MFVVTFTVALRITSPRDCAAIGLVVMSGVGGDIGGAPPPPPMAADVKLGSNVVALVVAIVVVGIGAKELKTPDGRRDAPDNDDDAHHPDVHSRSVAVSFSFVYVLQVRGSNSIIGLRVHLSQHLLQPHYYCLL